MYHPDLIRHPESCPALVLNADYTPLSYYPLSLWPWQTAIKAMFLERVDVVAHYDREVHSPSTALKLPSVIALLDIVQMLLWVLSIVIIAQAVFSWLVVFNVVNTRSDFVRTVWTALEKITEPLYRPIRRIMPDFGGIDFSPIVVLLLIWVISRLLGGVELDLQRSYYMGA